MNRLTAEASTMTLDNFDEVLRWLDPDRERAALKYEKIRTRIIMIYTNRGCTRADEIADETEKRVCRRVREVAATWKDGDPALFFYGVAKKVYLEFLTPTPSLPPPPSPDTRELERRHTCLESCLKILEPEERLLALQYYEGEKRKKIDNRKRLAERLGISEKTLSLRIHRIRRRLLPCLTECLEKSHRDEIDSPFFH